MLDTLRQQANKWFIKLLLSLVTASFVMWGIVDMVVRSQGNKPVAHVGSHRILLEELARRVDQVTQMLQRRSVKNVENATIVDHALKDLINSQFVEIELEHLGLVVSDTWLREVLRNMPVFQREGKFDPDAFRYLLAQNRLSEVKFLADLRDQLKTQNYTGAIISGVELPKIYRHFVIQAVNTPYLFSVAHFTTKNMPEPVQPSAEELRLYYTNNLQRYVLPEFRTVHVLHVDTHKITANVTVDEADVHALYKERESSWKKEEQRDIQRLTFPTHAAAQKAVDQLTEGKTLKQLSKEWSQAKYQEESYEQAQAPEALANILFTLKEGGNTGVVETPSGYSIYQVTHIHEARTQQLDKALHDQLVQEIRMARSGDTIKQWLDQLNDALAGGQKMTDVAKKFGLQVSTITLLANGEGADGKPCLPKMKLSDCENVAKEAFALSQGQTSPLIETSDKTSLVVSLQEVIPSRTPEFNEVSQAVKNNWITAAKEKMMEEKCRQLSKTSHPEEFHKMAASLGVKALQQKPISAAQLQTALNSEANAKEKAQIPTFVQDLDGQTVVNLFALQPGENIIGRTKDGGFAVIMLEKCLPPHVLDDKTFDAGLNAAFERDLSSLLLLALRKKHPVSIDTEVVKKFVDRIDQRH